MATINIYESKKEKILVQLKKDVERAESAQELYSRIQDYLEKTKEDKITKKSTKNTFLMSFSRKLSRLYIRLK